MWNIHDSLRTADKNKQCSAEHRASVTCSRSACTEEPSMLNVIMQTRLVAAAAVVSPNSHRSVHRSRILLARLLLFFFFFLPLSLLSSIFLVRISRIRSKNTLSTLARVLAEVST